MAAAIPGRGRPFPSPSSAKPPTPSQQPRLAGSSSSATPCHESALFRPYEQRNRVFNMPANQPQRHQAEQDMQAPPDSNQRQVELLAPQRSLERAGLAHHVA